jgi:DNA-directed RNA polymerase specialized sigma24 family protein
VFQAFRRIEAFEVRGEGALQAYLRQAVLNRIRMEIRRVGRRPAVGELAPDYSLGVLLYYLVTGSFPVQATTLDELRAARRPPTSCWNPWTPPRPAH